MKPAKGFVLALNAGPSGLKFALFDGDSLPVQILSGAIDRIGSPKATFTLKRIAGQQTERAGIPAPDRVSGLDYLLKRLSETTAATGFAAVGHRVVTAARAIAIRSAWTARCWRNCGASVASTRNISLPKSR